MWGSMDGGQCQPLTLAASGMDDTGHRKMWQSASGSLPSWQGAGLPMKTSSHVIFGRRAGLAAVLAGNAKYISYVMQYTYPIMNACQTYEIYWGI